MDEIALFPLRAVLLPGGRVPLQIFEPRYLDMVTRCMKGQLDFGIVRITEGHEVILAQGTRPPAICEIGTLAAIVDWDGLPAGRLRITVEGGRRFRIGACREQPDQLLLGEVEWLPDAEPLPLDQSYSHLAEIMAGLAEHPALARLGVQPNPRDAAQLAYQLAQYLPLDEADRYTVLAGREPMEGLAFLDRIVKELGGGP
jgi:Lon protease-like protein